MNRRETLALGAAFALAPSLAQAAIEYTPGLVAERLAAGETVFVDFTASWCTTCASQKRTITAFRQENPAYDAAVTFVDVDWDAYGNSDLAKTLAIPRRSTLVVLKGNQELGRIVAGTNKAQIKALMDTALAAASA